MDALYALPGNEDLADRLSARGAPPGSALDVHRFPDGESLVRIDPPPAGGTAVFVCTLDRPDAKILPLLMAAATARELGAARVGLVAPYLAYMRQDARFEPGQAVSAPIFGRIIGGMFDWLLTVDPHLHRLHALGEVYPLHAEIVHAAPRLAEWIGGNVERPLLIGPDGESAQWVEAVAGRLGVPWVVATKRRHGDRQVEVDLPDLDAWPERTPVVLDDIVSSGRTMIEALVGIRHRRPQAAPVCVAVHGVFADDALEELRAAGAARIVTTDTVPGPCAAIDLAADLGAMVERLCAPAVQGGLLAGAR